MTLPRAPPVVAAVSAVAQVHELVDHDVVNQAHGGLNDAPVQPDGAAVVAAPPPLLLVGDDDAGLRNAGPRPPRLHPFRQPLGGVTAEPGHEGGPDVRRLLRSRRRGYMQPAAAQFRLSGPRSDAPSSGSAARDSGRSRR